MDRQLVERVQVDDSPPAATDLPDAGARADAGAPVRRRTSGQDGWRWVPDPAEVEIPTPHRDQRRPLDPLIGALAWAGLRPWG